MIENAGRRDGSIIRMTLDALEETSDSFVYFLTTREEFIGQVSNEVIRAFFYSDM